MPELDSQQTWRSYRFDEMAVMVNDRIDDPSKADVEYYVGLEHLESESLTIRRWGSPSDVEATKLRFRAGDIIFGRRRVYQRKLGVAHFDGICSAHAMVLRAKPAVALPEFLPFFMQSDLFMERAKEISVGSLSPTINWKTLAKEEFALPPLDEQKRVAEVLRTAADHGQALGRLSTAASVLLQSTIDQAFAGQLVDASISVPRVVTEIGELPRTWSLHPLAAVCTKIVDGVHKRPDYVATGVPFLTVENLNRGPGIDFSDTRYVTQSDHIEFSRRASPQRGDVLVSKDGTLGVARVIETDREFSIFVSVALLKPQRSQLDPWFLRYYFDSTLFKRRLAAKVAGSALKHIHLVDFRGSVIPVPPLGEQEAIAGVIREADSAFRSCLSEEASARQLRRACLTHLLPGADE